MLEPHADDDPTKESHGSVTEESEPGLFTFGAGGRNHRNNEINWQSWGQHAGCVLQASWELDITKLEFVLETKESQTRRLNENGIATMLQVMKANQPTAPANVLVWLRDSKAERYVVLCGQHLVKAILALREASVAGGLHMERWMKVKWRCCAPTPPSPSACGRRATIRTSRPR